jgi:protein-S-isoprenylcysteine O-methyltransferase Ste14
MSSQLEELALLVLSWIVYFTIHSVLAGTTAKGWVARRLPHLMPVYRLSYNAIALVLLLVPVTLIYQINGAYWWRWTGALWWLVNSAALMALLAFLWSLRYYDGATFVGWRQLKRGLPRAEDPGSLQLSPFHRVVRHPWYFFGLVILWTRDMNAPFLVSAIIITLYLWVGSRLEERKLVYYYGEAYREYRKRVPGLIPLPGRTISAKDANRLMRSSLESKELRT